MLSDAHVHLDAYKEEDVDAVMERALQAGVGLIIAVGYLPASCERAVQLATRYPQVYAGVGIHPWEAESFNGKAMARMVELSAHTHNDRQSEADMLAVFREMDASRVGGVIHGFRGDYEYAKSCIDMGFVISFGKLITRPEGEMQRDVLKRLPRDRIVIETDSAGGGLGPAEVAEVAKVAADTLGIPVKELAELTERNLRRALRI